MMPFRIWLLTNWRTPAYWITHVLALCLTLLLQLLIIGPTFQFAVFLIVSPLGLLCGDWLFWRSQGGYKL